MTCSSFLLDDDNGEDSQDDYCKEKFCNENFLKIQNYLEEMYYNKTGDQLLRRSLYLNNIKFNKLVVNIYGNFWQEVRKGENKYKDIVSFLEKKTKQNLELLKLNLSYNENDELIEDDTRWSDPSKKSKNMKHGVYLAEDYIKESSKIWQIKTLPGNLWMSDKRIYENGDEKTNYCSKHLNPKNPKKTKKTNFFSENVEYRIFKHKYDENFIVVILNYPSDFLRVYYKSGWYNNQQNKKKKYIRQNIWFYQNDFLKNIDKKTNYEWPYCQDNSDFTVKSDQLKINNCHLNGFYYDYSDCGPSGRTYTGNPIFHQIDQVGCSKEFRLALDEMIRKHKENTKIVDKPHFTTYLLASLCDLLVENCNCKDIDLLDGSTFISKLCNPYTINYQRIVKNGQLNMYRQIGFEADPIINTEIYNKIINNKISDIQDEIIEDNNIRYLKALPYYYDY